MNMILGKCKLQISFTYFSSNVVSIHWNCLIEAIPMFSPGFPQIIESKIP